MSELRKWQRACAPTISELETLAADAWQRLPSEFQNKAKDVLIRVEDFGTDEVLDSLGIDSPFDLLARFGAGDLLGHRSPPHFACYWRRVPLWRRGWFATKLRSTASR